MTGPNIKPPLCNSQVYNSTPPAIRPLAPLTPHVPAKTILLTMCSHCDRPWCTELFQLLSLCNAQPTHPFEVFGILAVEQGIIQLAIDGFAQILGGCLKALVHENLESVFVNLTYIGAGFHYATSRDKLGRRHKPL